MVIELKGRQHCRILNYIGVPLWCVRCLAYGHVVSKCALQLTRKIWRGEDLEKPLGRGNGVLDIIINISEIEKVVEVNSEKYVLCK
jgi:hypothetical protein